jgi:hypothetical protein
MNHNDEIEYYIQNYKPFDKAGSYGIQEWLGMAKIKRYRKLLYHYGTSYSFGLQNFERNIKSFNIKFYYFYKIIKLLIIKSRLASYIE